jgi:hypothetical protein
MSIESIRDDVSLEQADQAFRDDEIRAINAALDADPEYQAWLECIDATRPLPTPVSVRRVRSIARYNQSVAKSIDAAFEMLGIH